LAVGEDHRPVLADGGGELVVAVARGAFAEADVEDGHRGARRVEVVEHGREAVASEGEMAGLLVSDALVVDPDDHHIRVGLVVAGKEPVLGMDRKELSRVRAEDENGDQGAKKDADKRSERVPVGQVVKRALAGQFRRADSTAA